MNTSVKLPSSSYDELAKIIMGYGSFGKEGSLADIARIVGVGTTVVSANNGFCSELVSLRVETRKNHTLGQPTF